MVNLNLFGLVAQLAKNPIKKTSSFYLLSILLYEQKKQKRFA